MLNNAIFSLEEIERIKEENEKAKKERLLLKKSIEEQNRKKAHTIANILKNVYNIVSVIILVAILILTIYCICVNNMPVEKVTLILLVVIGIEILGIIESFVPKYSRLKKWFFEKIDLFEERMYLVFKDKKEKELSELYKK